MILEVKHPKELIYKIINYSFWYWAYSLPLLYQKGYQEFLESVGIQMKERREYYQNMHSIVGKMPFKELMKQSPKYVYKSTFGRNQFKKTILWANETGLEYDYYYNHKVASYLDSSKNFDFNKLEKKYELLESKYSKKIQEFYDKLIKDNEISNLEENNDILKYFTKSYKVYVNEEYCFVVNRIFEERQCMKYNAMLLIDSYVYSEEYKIENYQSKLSKNMYEFFNTLNYPGEFNKENYTFACIDNLEKTELYYEEIMSVSINSKNYILESLARIQDLKVIEKMCEKKFLFIESVQNRCSLVHFLSAYPKEYEAVTYQEVMQYRKEMNDEISD